MSTLSLILVIDLQEGEPHYYQFLFIVQQLLIGPLLFSRVAFGTLSPMISDVLRTVLALGRGLGVCCWGSVGVTGGAACCGHVVNRCARVIESLSLASTFLLVQRLKFDSVTDSGSLILSFFVVDFSWISSDELDTIFQKSVKASEFSRYTKRKVDWS
ncbi:hypothetical protein J6590_051696 [Homalodisca vitripennis]|nr:hypothetical protein J6590_051696 [Homalodisca vitripennis]